MLNQSLLTKNKLLMKRSFIVCLLSFFLLLSQFAFAEIKLPAIVSSNMVLQRDTEIVIWGWADAKEKITVNASWINEPIEFKADKEGNWRVTVKTTNSKDPQTITLKSKVSDIRLENILFGEVPPSAPRLNRGSWSSMS